jgi:O-antigen/teichoic acid export membrane protein
VSALVSDRVAVAQWGLTRVIAGVLRMLCYQTTLPLAAELGHDHALGKKHVLRNLYARGSVLVTLLASIVVSGLLPFWADFFELWTHGSVPYDPLLTITLLIGTSLVAPSILALSFASYSNRGDILVRSKGLQLAVFLLLALVLIPLLGPLGAAIAIVTSDLLVQFGLLGLTILRQTLRHPFQHLALLAAIMIIVILCGWLLGAVIRSILPWGGLIRLVVESTAWLAVVMIGFSPLASKSVRSRLIAAIPA